MASVQPQVAEHSTGSSARLYRVSYNDTVVRETFVLAQNESEAEDIVVSQIADAEHHHAIDTYQNDMRAEAVAEIGRRPTCFECGNSADRSLDFGG
jgi:hypothetical protein